MWLTTSSYRAHWACRACCTRFRAWLLDHDIFRQSLFLDLVRGHLKMRVDEVRCMVNSGGVAEMTTCAIDLIRG